MKCDERSICIYVFCLLVRSSRRNARWTRFDFSLITCSLILFSHVSRLNWIYNSYRDSYRSSGIWIKTEIVCCLKTSKPLPSVIDSLSLTIDLDPDIIKLNNRINNLLIDAGFRHWKLRVQQETKKKKNEQKKNLTIIIIFTNYTYHLKC